MDPTDEEASANQLSSDDIEQNFLTQFSCKWLHSPFVYLSSVTAREDGERERERDGRGYPQLR